jgi:hypothetical protein
MPLPADVQDDDTYVGAVATAGPGRRSVYAPDAIVYNRVPSTVPDYLNQRWRINRQVLGLRQATGIVTSTWEPNIAAGAVWRHFREHPRDLPYLAALAGSEGLVRLGALAIRLVHRAPLVEWQPIASTKSAIRVLPPPRGPGTQSEASGRASPPPPPGGPPP